MRFLFAAPLLAAVLSIPILGERVGMHRWLAVVAGLAGVLIVLRPGAQPLGLGHAAALAAAMGSAMPAVILRKLGRSERPLVLLMWPMLGNFLATGASLAIEYRPMELPHPTLAGGIARTDRGIPVDPCLSRRRGGDRRPDAVFADPPGHGLWLDRPSTRFWACPPSWAPR